MGARKLGLLGAGLALAASLAWWALRPARRDAQGPPSPAPAGPSTATPWAAPRPRLALVLDDWGYSTRFLDRLARLDARVTAAVLPGLPHSRACALAAHAAGHEVILHLPLEPEGNLPLVPGTLMTGMGGAEVAALCERHAATVPYMAGLNNHEGSRGSADAALMSAVALWLGRRGGYFLDSATSVHSVIPREAARAGLRWGRRKVFLDNLDSQPAVEAQLRGAARRALAEGACIAIGHPRAGTFGAIEDLLPGLKAMGLDLVPASLALEP